MLILVVEDDVEMAELVCEALRADLYAVDLASTGEEASERMAVGLYDLVVLDWSIPPPSGMQLLETWRREGIDTPVLMITGRDTVEDRAEGLDRGADDYLTKPFSFRELLARVRSLLRRREVHGSEVRRAGDLCFDQARRQATIGGEVLSLSAKELELLEFLLRRRDQVVSRRELEENVWDSAFDSAANVVDVTVFRLRKKIDAGRRGRLLHTVRGKGYILRGERC